MVNWERVREIDELLSSAKSLMILLYLEQFNPDVSLVDLEKNLKIGRVDLLDEIMKLIYFDLVNKEDSSYQLTEYGRVIINRLNSF